MEKIGEILIKIEGQKGNLKLSPDNFDIREIRSLLENFENLLFPTEKKDRPIISYKIEEGSIINKFKTALQYIVGFNALIGLINQSGNIDFLEPQTAEVFESFQDNAIKKDMIFSISTSIEDSITIKIDKTTNLRRTETIWADAEFYFYGKITNMGGKDKANIHLVTDELGTLIIQTPKLELERIENNPLYKSYGIRAKGKQHVETGKIDKSSLKFIELINYNPYYDKKYLISLREKANKWIKEINPDEWLRSIRGEYNA
jgi:hypothetical protein